MPLIAIEGIEASGKTTFAKALIEYLDQEGYKTYYTADPAHEGMSADIRHMICKNKYKSLTTLMLISAARSNNYYEIIKPQMNNDVVVITDRFVLTSYVYHAEACGYSTVRDLHNIATESIIPWKTFIVDVPAEIAADRIKIRKDKTDIFDNVPIEQLNKWRYGFLDASEKYKLASENDYIILNGTDPVKSLLTKARSEINAIINSEWYKKDVN